jgi:hypothetical protein
VRPDRLTAFRIARLLLLISTAGFSKRPAVGLERLAYYDFFADAPLLIFEPGTDQYRRLVLAGFSRRNLSYSSAAQRFTNRRARLQHDLALLVSRQLIAIDRSGRQMQWAITEAGSEVASRFRSLYALAFRESAELVVTRLWRLSDAALERDARAWLRAEPFLIDLVDDPEDGS